MPVEIELKAWLDDYESIKGRLSSLGSYVRSYEKTDTYWYPIDEGVSGVTLPRSGLRIRRDRSTDAGSERVLVTLKKGQVSGGVEVNEEREFSVSNADVFEELICDLGLFKGMYKKKYGWEWMVPSETEGLPPIGAEVSMVKDLGWFLELELIVRDKGDPLMEKSRKELLSLLERLEISSEKMEARSYTALLRDRWQNK